MPALPQMLFPMAIRIWDIYILEGEHVLTTMACTALKFHRSKSSGPTEARVLRMEELGVPFMSLVSRA